MYSRKIKGFCSLLIVFCLVFTPTIQVQANPVVKKALEWLGGMVIEEIVKEGFRYLLNGTSTANNYNGNTYTKKNDITPSATPEYKVYENPKIDMTKLNVYHNKIFKNRKGIILTSNFNTFKLKGVQCEMVAFMYYRNGKKLIDKDGSYRTTDGQVAMSSDYFIPPHDGASYKNASVFIPYKQLDLKSEGKKISLKMEIEVRTVDNKIVSNVLKHSFFVE